MIRRLIARLRRRPQQPETFEDWRKWQDRDFHERLRERGSS